MMPVHRALLSLSSAGISTGCVRIEEETDRRCDQIGGIAGAALQVPEADAVVAMGGIAIHQHGRCKC